jgi:uncharacterized protein (TIGR02147 family)
MAVRDKLKIKDALPNSIVNTIGINTGLERPKVKRYTSYRDYLKDFYLYRKNQRKNFSHRKFAELAGIKSPNFLQLVMQGKRNMSEEMSSVVSKAMGLVGSERSYFLALVRKEAAKVPSERADANRRLVAAAGRLALKKNQSNHGKLLSVWYHVAVLEMISLVDFQANGAWISKRLGGLITPSQADESLNLLLKGGFVEQTAEGQLVTKEILRDTEDLFDFARILKSHMQTLELWQRILPQLGSEERELGLLVIAINKKSMQEFKERILRFQEEIIQWLATEENPDTIVQLGTYLVPLTQTLPLRHVRQQTASVH